MATPTTTVPPVTHEVHLAIYDLSGGMARSLSSQFLGPDHAIDVVPHTAILAFGREYYFGGGIASVPPDEFRRTRGIHPLEIQSLGRTSRNRSDFEAWCRSVSDDGTFGPYSYDLLHNNCNNFSHHAALRGLALSRGVPEWILDVPRRFLSSPMGQMLRPMFEQMQVTGGGGGGMGGFSSGGGGGGGMAPPLSGGVRGPDEFTFHDPAPAAAADVNPWASLPGPTTASSPTAAAGTTHDAAATSSGGPPVTPTLDSYDRPLLSDDTSNATLCVSRLLSSRRSHSSSGDESIGDDNDDNDAYETSLRQLGQSFEKSKGTTKEDGLTFELSANDLKGAMTALLSHLDATEEKEEEEEKKEEKEQGGTDVFFALMLLRLVILQDPEEKDVSRAVAARLIDCDGKLRESAASRSMAWCVLGNAVGGGSGSSISSRLLGEDNDDERARDGPTLEVLLDSALVDINPADQTRSEVRQSASAFLYNVALSFEDDADTSQADKSIEDEGVLSEAAVSMLCGALEGVSDETDSTALLRRLLVVGKMLSSPSSGKAAKELATDLGFGDLVDSLTLDDTVGTPGNREDAKKVVQEIQSLLAV